MKNKLAGVVQRVRSPSHSVGLTSAVFQRKLAQTVAFNWFLQIQNVYSALHRSSQQLHGQWPWQLADVQEREADAEPRYAARWLRVSKVEA